MNDRFKFRVWSKGEQCVDHQHPDEALIDTQTGECAYWDGFANCNVPMEDVIIEQCTGLKDKNGDLIYEGDILQAAADVYRTVQWDDDGFAIKSQMGFFLYPAEWSAHEIIGNIHENGDLLK